MSAQRSAALSLPIPGPVWGLAPERDPGCGRPRLIAPSLRPYRERIANLAREAQAAESRWRGLTQSELPGAVRGLRQDLRRRGLCAATATEALGAVGAIAGRTLGVEVYTTQHFAALVLLDGRLAEMATGEGKTLAVALAAAVAGLAGTPVHVITANDYLVRRDATELAPLYERLGLRVGHVTADLAAADRGAAYGASVVYCTAKELVFDYLRDGLEAGSRCTDPQRRAAALGGPGEATPVPLLRGLCMAIIDEADSILIDEATVPLVISRAQRRHDRRAFLWQSLMIARQMTAGRDFMLLEDPRRAQITAAGAGRLAELSSGLRGPWRRERYARESVSLALTALNVLRRDEDYLVRDGAVLPLDLVTGRATPGRLWSRGLHALLELKEGCALTAETDTVARITYQQFFPRYVHLCGLSGSLLEAARELRRTYGLRVMPVPLRRPCQRRDFGVRLFPDADARWSAVVERVGEMRARAALIGTDSIQEAEELGRRLALAGIGHNVLHAHNDAAEAAIIARAGVAGGVTVATRMAGRGTDIRLGPGVAEAGGLHVINCQWNASRRLDRQLAGRAARQGDPGSIELCFRCDQDRGIGRYLPSQLPWAAGYLRGLATRITGSAWLLRLLAVVIQRRLERGQERIRRQLLQQERKWARQMTFSRRGP